MTEPCATRYSLIIRAWRESGHDDESSVWRFSLEDVQGDRIEGYSTLEHLSIRLYSYLKFVTARTPTDGRIRHRSDHRTDDGSTGEGEVCA